ncbi:MAG: hypothetical protein LBB60_00515 [Desulfovibrio sp.]|jgi:hypothetical protein|nr:hypothetical protein [Desulfovibrio sp.]
MCSQVNTTDEQAKTNQIPNSYYDILGSWMPVNLNLFMIVEEIGKDGMLVRKIRNYGPLSELNGSYKGLFPKSPYAGTSVVEHVMDSKHSRFISASTLFPEGPPNFQGGKQLYFDINKAMQAGSRIVSSEEIVAGLREYMRQYPHTAERVNRLINAVQNIEGEVLIEPPVGQRVPSGAIWRPEQYKRFVKMAQYARVVQVFGIAMTAYHIGNATDISFRTRSVAPITAEAVRQAGGWGAAWLGFKLGGAAGAAVTAETGPGAIVGGLIGGIIVGACGYWGADWVADLIYEN